MTGDTLINLYAALKTIGVTKFDKEAIELLKEMTDGDAKMIIANPAKWYYYYLLTHQITFDGFSCEEKDRIKAIHESIQDDRVRMHLDKAALYMCQATGEFPNIADILQTISVVDDELKASHIATILSTCVSNPRLSHKDVAKIIKIVVNGKSTFAFEYVNSFISLLPYYESCFVKGACPSYIFKIIERLANARGEEHAVCGYDYAQKGMDETSRISDPKLKVKSGKDVAKILALLTNEKNDEKVHMMRDILTHKKLHDTNLLYYLALLIKKARDIEVASYIEAAIIACVSHFDSPTVIFEVANIISSAPNGDIANVAFYTFKYCCCNINSDYNKNMGISQLLELLQIVASATDEMQASEASQAIYTVDFFSSEIYNSQELLQLIRIISRTVSIEQCVRVRNIISNTLILNSGKALKYGMLASQLDPSTPIEISREQLNEIVRLAKTLKPSVVCGENEYKELYRLFDVYDSFWEMFAKNPEAAIRDLGQTEDNLAKNIDGTAKVRVRSKDLM